MLHEAENEAEAKTHEAEAEATKFGLPYGSRVLTIPGALWPTFLPKHGENRFEKHDGSRTRGGALGNNSLCASTITRR